MRSREFEQGRRFVLTDPMIERTMTAVNLCSTCAHWLTDPQDLAPQGGQCRRYPPQVVVMGVRTLAQPDGTVAPMGICPSTAADFGCGEWVGK